MVRRALVLIVAAGVILGGWLAVAPAATRSGPVAASTLEGRLAAAVARFEALRAPALPARPILRGQTRSFLGPQVSPSIRGFTCRVAAGATACSAAPCRRFAASTVAVVSAVVTAGGASGQVRRCLPGVRTQPVVAVTAIPVPAAVTTVRPVAAVRPGGPPGRAGTRSGR